VGKSTLALQSVVCGMLADRSLGVILCLYECEVFDEVLDRLHCTLAGVRLDKYEAGQFTADEQGRVQQAAKIIEKNILPRTYVRLRQHDAWTKNWRHWIYEWERSVEKLQRLRSCSRVITVVDRMQKMPIPIVLENLNEYEIAECARVAADPDTWRLQQIFKACKSKVNENQPYGLPFLVISEMRKTDTSKRPLGIEDLLGSVSLGYEVDRVLLLQADGNPEGDVARTKLKIAKARRGECSTLDLRFRYREHRFEEFTTPIEIPTIATKIEGKAAGTSTGNRFRGR